jgi:hypothetical protein
MEPTQENFEWTLKQVSRMAVLPGYPSGEHKDIAITEYVKFLVWLAREREAIEWTIDTAVRQEERCPPPVFLREILERRYWPSDRELLPGMPGYVAKE